MLFATDSQAEVERSASGRVRTWVRTPTRPFPRPQPEILMFDLPDLPRDGPLCLPLLAMAHHRLVLRLWTCTCSPFLMSATVLPMSWPYFMTVSPFLMSTSAILWPIGTSILDLSRKEELLAVTTQVMFVPAWRPSTTTTPTVSFLLCTSRCGAVMSPPMRWTTQLKSSMRHKRPESTQGSAHQDGSAATARPLTGPAKMLRSRASQQRKVNPMAPYKSRSSLIAAALATAIATLGAASAGAETRTIRIAKQFGISYLPLTVMEEKKFLEERGKSLGIDIKTEWVQFVSGAPLNAPLISGNLDFASGGAGPLLTIWGKTRGNIGVKGVAAINAMPLYLNSIDPKVKTIKDFTEKDRIALPAVKVSIQAVTLQMAAEKVFGLGQQNKLDNLTVSLSHPDGMTNMMSGRSEITALFPSEPFMHQELEDRRAHKVI